MRLFQACISILLLVLIPIQSGARDASEIWDDRCEECHGDSVKFASKYLWNVDGQLQGQHHIDNLDLFLGNHYIPDHAIEVIRKMLLTQANSPLRYVTECSGCHGSAAEFVAKSIWVRGSEVRAMEAGMDVGEFLPTHLELPPEDIAFYRKLFARIAGKPIL